MQKNTLAAIIFSAAFFLVFVLVLPQYDSIKTAKGALPTRRNLLAERTAAVNKIVEAQKQVQSRQADINKIKSFLPERKQIDEVVSSIQNISESSGMQLLGMITSAVPGIDDNRYKKILVGVDLIGQYPAFVNFLKLLEQSLRLYDVSEINAAASTTVPGNVNFTIKMNAYYLK